MKSLEVEVIKYTEDLLLNAFPASKTNYSYKADTKNCVDSISLCLFPLLSPQNVLVLTYINLRTA